MQLILRAVRCPAGISLVSSSFGAEGGDIGRSPDCTLALPDTQRYISRVHAEIRQSGGSFFLKVLSKVNPVGVNGAPVGFNQMVELKAGDQITLGDYSFVAEINQAAAAPRNDFGLSDPFALFDGLRQSAQPTEDALKQNLFFQDKAFAPVPDASEARPAAGFDLIDLVQGQTGPGSDPLLDILQTSDAKAAGKTGIEPPRQSRPTPPGADDLAVDRFLGTSLGENLGLTAAQQTDSTLPGSHSRASHADHVHAINLPFNAPARTKPASAAAIDGGMFDDLLGSLSNPPAPAQPQAPASPSPAAFPDDLFSVLDGLIEPAPAARAEVSKPASVAAPEHRISPAMDSDALASNDALIVKLAEGLNMPNLAIQPDEMQAFMFELGRMFRITVEGVHSLLLLRAEVKKELRAEDRTMIASRENNPLKHTESIEEALQYLLAFGAANPAFLPPARAMEDAFKDIRAHELAVMAGMRAGLAGVLKRFDPKNLEPRIKKTGALDSVLPTLYKAKLWDCYIEFYKDIESEAEDHFDKLFGREFVRAYMEQTKQLKKRNKT